MRPHPINPSVTLIMQTVGCHQDRITAAIRSALAQTYPVTLLIVNTHPDRLVIHNAPPSVLVHNIPDVFKRPVEQHVYSQKKVVTDCWSILDDDDTIDSGHVAQLVEAWNSVRDLSRTDAPLRVSVPRVKAVYAARTVTMDIAGWMTCLFETLTPDEVDYLYKLFPADAIVGDDSWISSNTYWDKRDFPGVATYNWDRTGSRHISAHETNAGRTAEEKYRYALNYWKIKIAARAEKLQAVTL